MRWGCGGGVRGWIGTVETLQAWTARVASRNATGSLPTACAISSMKVSSAYAVCVDPTARHQSTDTGEVVVVLQSRRRFSHRPAARFPC